MSFSCFDQSNLARIFLRSLLGIMLAAICLSGTMAFTTQRVEAVEFAPATECGGSCAIRACPQSIGEVCNCMPDNTCLATPREP